MGDTKDREWRETEKERERGRGREVSELCCKTSAGPCKLSDKLRVLKPWNWERYTHTFGDTHTHTDADHCEERKCYS